MKIDRQFEPDRGNLALLNNGLSTVAKSKHAPEIYQLQITIKEIVLDTYNEIKRHFTNISGVLIREKLYATVFWINSFPAYDGISNKIIPQDMLTGIKLCFSHHCIV